MNETIIIKVIQYIILEDLHINIRNKNFPSLSFDILYYTIISYADSSLGSRLGYVGRHVSNVFMSGIF